MSEESIWILIPTVFYAGQFSSIIFDTANMIFQKYLTKILLNWKQIFISEDVKIRTHNTASYIGFFQSFLYCNYLNSSNFCLTNNCYSLQLIVTLLFVNKSYLEADQYSLFLINLKS